MATSHTNTPTADQTDDGRRGLQRARPFLITDRDLRLIAFVAAHRFVLAGHIRELLGVDRAVAYRRLSGLVGVGLLSYRRIFHAQPGIYQITNGGLAVIDSQLPKPTIDLRTYGHDLGVVSLAVAAEHDRLGAVDRVWSEREMRSHDQRPETGLLFGVPLGLWDRYGRPRVHYPDLVLTGPGGGRIAVELELSMKGRKRLEGILAAYGSQPGITEVLYLTDQPGIQARVREIVAAFGLEQLVSVQYLDRSLRVQEPSSGRRWQANLMEVGL
jgi:hypothetical protein